MDLNGCGERKLKDKYVMDVNWYTWPEWDESKYGVLTFGSSWSFTTLAARAIGWAELVACSSNNQKNCKIQGFRGFCQFRFLLLLCWCTIVSRSLGERMRTKMIRTRMRMMTMRKNMIRQKMRTVVDEGCCCGVSLVSLGCRAILIVFMDKDFESFQGHWTRFWSLFNMNFWLFSWKKRIRRRARPDRKPSHGTGSALQCGTWMHWFLDCSRASLFEKQWILGFCTKKGKQFWTAGKGKALQGCSSGVVRSTDNLWDRKYLWGLAASALEDFVCLNSMTFDSISVWWLFWPTDIANSGFLSTLSSPSSELKIRK